MRVFVCDIIRPNKKLPVQSSNLSTGIRCESCLILIMSMLTIFNIKDCQWRRSSAVVLTVDFEQVRVCLVHSEKANIFEDKIGHIMCYVLF